MRENLPLSLLREVFIKALYKSHFFAAEAQLSLGGGGEFLDFQFSFL